MLGSSSWMSYAPQGVKATDDDDDDEGSKFVDSMQRPLLPPRDTSGTHFC